MTPRQDAVVALAAVVAVALPRAAVGAYSVTAAVETVPVPHGGDAADDPCIWVHPTDRSQSTIIGTDKQGGIAVYALDGSEIDYRKDGKINNIDVRYNFQLASEHVDLVAGTNRSNNSIVVYRIDPATRKLVDVSARVLSAGISVYGFCLYRSPVSDSTYAFVNDQNGVVQQWVLGDNGSGLVDARLVRQFDVGTIVEGCVADDVTADFYVAEEQVGIWKYGAEPGDGTDRVLVDAVGSRLGEVEGLTLYYTSVGTGYLLASSQGTNAFNVYERAEKNAYLTTFTIASSESIDAVTATDGIDVTNVDLGGIFAQGLFVAQDDSNTGANQNFKLVAWPAIAIGAPAPLTIDTEWDPRGIGPTAVALAGFEAVPHDEGVWLRWRATAPHGEIAFHVYRASTPEAPPTRLDPAAVTGGPEYSFLDRTAQVGETYLYRLGIVESGVETASAWIAATRGSVAVGFRVDPPVPNPTRAGSQIRMTLDRTRRVEVRIYDPAGRLVRELVPGALAPGARTVAWDGRDREGRALPNGTYFAHVTAEDRRGATRITLLR